MTPVGVGREELRDEVPVAGVYLDAVETGVTGVAHGIAEVSGHLLDLVSPQPSAESR